MIDPMVSADIWRIDHIFRPKNDKKYEVPLYQRGYSWETEHVEYFCSDLWETDKVPGKKHPFGTIYTETRMNGQEKIIIIDGQQRITTSAIFLCVVRDYVDEISPANKIADDWNELLYVYNNTLLCPDLNSPVLSLSRLNSNYFLKFILKRKIYSSKSSDLDKTENDSCENLKDAYVSIRIFIIAKLEEEKIEKPNDQVVKLNHIVNTLTQNFELIHIDVPSELEAYLMFNTINNRGLKLAEADLIKHHLFTKLDNELKQNPTVDVEDKLNDYDESWTDLRNKITQEDLADYDIGNFIHHHLVVFHNPDSRKEMIFDQVEKYSENKPIVDVIDQMVDWGSNFYNLRKPDNFFAGEHEIQYYLKRIKELKYSAVYPVIIAGYERFWKNQDKESFKKLIEILFKFHIRNKLISRLGATPFEEFLKKTAKLIMDGVDETDPQTNEQTHRDTTLTDVVKKLTSDIDVYRPVEIVELNLDILSVANAKVTSALLQEIERAYDPDKKPGDDVSVEHIMPASKKKWADYIKEKNNLSTENDLLEFHTRYRNYLGNQTLLPLPKNKSLSNKPFDEKKIVYGQSTYKIANRIAEYSDWTEKEILATQEEYKKKLIEVLDIEKMI